MKIDNNSENISSRPATEFKEITTSKDTKVDDINVNTLTEQEKNLMPVSEKAIIDAIEKANKFMINNNTRAEFSVHAKTKDIVVKIINTDDNKVIREFPQEKILDLVAKIWEMAGLFVDERR